MKTIKKFKTFDELLSKTSLDMPTNGSIDKIWTLF